MCLPALINTRYKNESMTVHILFSEYVIWNITHDLLVMDWHFKDYFATSCIIILYVIHVSYRMYTLHITWPGLD